MTDDLRLLLENIRQEAHRREADGMSLAEAYSQAIDLVMMQAAEGQVLDHFEKQVIVELKQAERDFGGKPVPTKVLEARLGFTDRIAAWRCLSNLEKRGFIYRPFGRNSKAGWRAA